MRSTRLGWSRGTWLGLLVTACTPVKAPDPVGPVAAAARGALSIDSRDGCTLDEDCAAGLFCFEGRCGAECDAATACAGTERCGERGRCLKAPAAGLAPAPESSTGEVAARPTQLPSLQLASPPDSVLFVEAGQAMATLSLTLSDDVPATGFLYRVERDDDPDSARVLRRASGTGRSVALALPTRVADPSTPGARVVQATVVTPFARISTALVPARPADGTYVGTASITAFGSTGLPLQLELLTDPPRVPLAQARSAWLALPVDDAALFSPVNSRTVTTKRVVRPLAYDEFVEKWVAVFDHAFDLTGQPLLTPASTSQVRRTLRFEVEPFGRDELIGTFKDTWTGLYERRTTAGVTSLEPVLFEGTVSLRRFQAPPENALPPVAFPQATPMPLPAPTLTECQPAAFAVPDVTTGGIAGSCQGIASAAAFTSASADARASCAIALAEAGLSTATTGADIKAFLDDAIPDPGGLSFADYLDQCARQLNGRCVPSGAVRCARQALAVAARAQVTDSPLSRQVVASFQRVSRELSLGRSLGAFTNDMSLRKTWLERADYPAVVTSEVKQLNAQLLADWQAKVLDVHFAVLREQLDASGLAVLSRDVSDPAAVDARRQLLLELTQSWRGSLDALTLGARRWNVLYQDAASRSERARFVSQRTFELYLAAGVLKNLNLAAGAGYLSASLASGFAELQRESSRIALPFDRLIYARDAEVVVSTSVDPSATNDTLLRERREAALGDLERAQMAMGQILSQIRAEALRETELRNRMSNDINDLRSELIELCGLPVGCTLQMALTSPSCQPLVEAGRCGFAVSSADGGLLPFERNQNVSRAGRVLLEALTAYQGVRVASAELDAQVERTSLMEAETQAFAADLSRWAERRRAGLVALQANFAMRTDFRNAQLAADLKAAADKAAERQMSITAFRESVNTWNTLRLGNAEYEARLLIASTTARTTANSVNAAIDSIRNWSQAAKDGLPSSIDDFFGPVRLALRMAENGATTLLQAGAQAAIVSADALDAARERNQLFQQAAWANVADSNALGTLVDADTLAKIDEELKVTTGQNQAQLDRLSQVAQLAKEELEASLTIERDAAELRRRQTELARELQQIAALELRVLQAGTVMEQKEAEYLGVVQRAQLVAAKLAELERQRAAVNQLVGSPSALFGRANRLTQAEQRLELAKDQLMEWLVALEYLAVRPFMDQRLQILLANNTFQLEKIARELQRLQSACGGAVNVTRTELSLRRELLEVNEALKDAVTGRELSATERFRTLLRRGAVPVDKRIRYKADSTVGRLLLRSGDVLSATFNLGFSDFANLDTTCNAKLRRVDVQLVGALGTARPTVSLLYDGASQLRSCQPGIDEYVALFGPESTAYGSTTLLRTPGRSVSPVAGLNAFPEGTGNLSLGGLPLVSQYTLLIDTAAAENARLDWTKLEDVVVRVEYSYQDLFPVGRCQ